jgi:hypothetical protein
MNVGNLVEVGTAAHPIEGVILREYLHSFGISCRVAGPTARRLLAKPSQYRDVHLLVPADKATEAEELLRKF